MPVKDQKKPAPKAKAPVEEHRKHADEILAMDEYKEKPGALGKSDEAKP